MTQIPNIELNDGHKIPALGLGTWQMEEATCKSAIPIAYRLGYRAIDTAYAYYNEVFIGEAISSLPREELFITSKLWREFHDPKRVEEACDHSLKDLKTDYLDLYLIHWPERTNMLDILAQMQRLQEKGKVKSIGVCNSTIRHLEQILKQGIKIAVNQVEFHPFLNQKELFEFCKKKQITMTAYSPIVQGAVKEEKALVEIGKKYEKSPAQVSLRWLLQKGLVVIPKASSEPHLKENINVFDFTLTEKDMLEIEKIQRTHRVVLPDFNEFDL